MSSENRQCFVTCAVGDRYKAYRDSLVSALSAYSGGVEVVELGRDMLEEAFPQLAEQDRPAFARLAAPLLPRFDGYDRLVWVDADIDVISSGFAGLMDAEAGQEGVAATLDIEQTKRLDHMRKRFPEYDKAEYFNTGVLVMDMRVIDRGEWRRRIEYGIEEHLRSRLKMPAQDIMNLMFSMSRLDQRYNWIWRSEVDAVNGAYAVHYCGHMGHDKLDGIMEMRKDWKMEEKKYKLNDRCIVVSPRHDFIRPWIRAYFRSGNTIPLVIVPGPPGDWRDGDMEYCQKAAEFCGGMVFDCSAEWESSKRLADRAVRKHMIGWFTKKNILRAVAARLAPKAWAWIDDDAEVTGNLDECFDYAERSPGFICTQFYIPDSIDNRHPAGMYRSNIDPGDKICWNSLVFFHGEASKRLAEDLDRDFPIEDDEIVFCNLYQNDPRWHDAFCDFSSRGWQMNCKLLKHIPKEWGGKLLHYTAHHSGSEVKKMWAAKADKLPMAPFEAAAAKVEVRHEDGEPVDAVFVIGGGSIGNNEELRYALRNLAEHCRFVRDVYICGVCPPWVDKTAVKHLQWPDRFRHAKDANIIDKLRHACEYPGIAKKILFCSDDQFQTRECKWEDFRPRYLRRYMSNDDWYESRHRVWHARLRKTLERDVQRRREAGLDASHVFYYQPHIWMPIDRDKFIEYAKWCNYEHRDDTIIASGYFNFIDAEGSPDFDHTFLRGDSRELPSTTHVAYHDGSYKVAMGILREMFPKQCRFEAKGADPIPSSTRWQMDEMHINTTGATSQSLGADNAAHDYSGAIATKKELDDILRTTASVRDNSLLHPLLGEISRAEELRLFGVKGWRVVWNDIIRRWRKSTDGRMSDPMMSPRSQAASEVVLSYLANPDKMRTVRFGQADDAKAADPNAQLRDRVRTSLLGRA